MVEYEAIVHHTEGYLVNRFKDYKNALKWLKEKENGKNVLSVYIGLIKNKVWQERVYYKKFMKNNQIKYLLEWHSPDGDFIYGYKTYEELLEVIDTFKGEKYIHYNVWQITAMQKMIFEN